MEELKTRIPIEKQKVFIEEFKRERPVFKEYATLLDSVLNKAVEKLSVLAIVQVRPKGIISFSNKIISKDKYQNPLTDMTDLCGARVIVHFQSQVEKVCNFIKENFEIDEANSLDTKSRLQVNEFGYRSVHYIVTPKKNEISGVAIDEKFKKLKAEIQVRTLAEHVWADISHDRIYKTDLIIPEEWKREAARLSAILENTDKIFADMSQKIDSVSIVYELQYEKVKAGKDIVKFKTLIDVMSDEVDESVINCLRLSAIYRAMDKFTEAEILLKPWLDKAIKTEFIHAKLLFEYGLILCLSSGNDIHADAYTQGIYIIKKSLGIFNGLTEELKKENKEELSYIYYRYGRLMQRNEEESRQLAEYFTKAYNIIPENPLYLVALMESLVLRNIDIANYNISLYKANLKEAITKIEELIEIGIKRVPAWFAIGHCYLMLDDEKGCINAYSKAVECILNKRFLTSHTTVAAEIAIISKFKAINPKLSNQIKLFLNICMFLMEENSVNTRYKTYLESHRIKKETFKSPVVIIAGGASYMDILKVEDFSAYISEIMHDFKGSILSGGTIAGIPGLVGKIKDEIEENESVHFDLIAYLPKRLPIDAIKSEYYNQIYETDSDEFSALDIISCWTDLISNGINPKDVILIGIDGGEIAAMEYKIALSLGAKVGLVTYSGRAASDLLQDKAWKTHPNLIQLPNDPLTLWALVNQSAETILTEEEINELAPKVHDFYQKKRMDELKPDTNDINKFKVLMPWSKLDSELQNSNIQQVSFYEHILNRVGLSIRKSDNPHIIKINETVSEEEYVLLAKLEHARWNAERLLEGWRYAANKDIEKKLNPSIVSWDQLDEETRKYDFMPIDNIPLLLGKIGYEVYKL